MSLGPWFKCFQGDLLAAMHDMDARKQGFYCQIIFRMYDAADAIYADDRTIGRWCNSNARPWVKIKEELIAEGRLTVLPDGGLINPRALKEMNDQAQKNDQVPDFIRERLAKLSQMFAESFANLSRNNFETFSENQEKTRHLIEARSQKLEDNDKSLSSARDIFDFWNSKAKAIKSWTIHKKLTDKIKASVTARAAEYSPDEVVAFIEALSNQAWATQGKYSSGTLEFVCRPSTFAKHFDKLVQDGRPVAATKPTAALRTASIIPMGQKETIDELLAKRDAERERSGNHEVGVGTVSGDASPHLPGMQPPTKKETPEVPERDEEWFEDPSTLPPLPVELRA